MKNRRLHPRTHFTAPAEVRRGDGMEWEKATIRDLSAGGAAIQSLRRFEVQSEVSLRFRLPDGADADPVLVRCLVVRGIEDTADSIGPNRTGLHFLDLTEDDFERIRRFVWERLSELD